MKNNIMSRTIEFSVDLGNEYKETSFKMLCSTDIEIEKNIENVLRYVLNHSLQPKITIDIKDSNIFNNISEIDFQKK